MKVGDYVRIKTLSGQSRIAKLEKIDDICITDNGAVDKNNIFKSSPSIIDLIKVGDYVNGEKVIALRKDINESNIHMNSKDNLIFTDYDIANNWYFGIDTDKIKSILTKEQFESMKYKIGSE